MTLRQFRFMTLFGFVILAVFMIASCSVESTPNGSKEPEVTPEEKYPSYSFPADEGNPPPGSDIYTWVQETPSGNQQCVYVDNGYDGGLSCEATTLGAS